MKRKISWAIAFTLVILSGCSVVSPTVVTPTVPVQASEVISEIPPIGEHFELTVSIRDENFHSKVYLLKVGCLDSTPCIITTRLLFGTAYPVTELSWSPDGHSLAFDGRGDGSSDIFVTLDEGKTINNVTKSQELNEGSPQWSPDGKLIGYSVHSSLESSKILVSSPDGANTKQILSDVFEPIQFTWSQNGMMSYSAFVSTLDGRYQIRVLNSGGSVYWLTPLDESKKDFGTANAAFSPDDNWLVYTGGWLNNTRIYLANLKTKTAEELFRMEKDCSELKPSWSPDGKWLAFISNCESENTQQYYLYLAGLSEKQKIKLDIGIDGNIQDVAWRPFSK